ncbi:MAG: hypothetical protein WDA03_08435 [Trueperaceae bacterium]
MTLEEQIRDLVVGAVESAVAQARAVDSPLLLSIKDAQARTGIARDRLIQAFHAGDIEGIWSAGYGRGQILLKTASVEQWVNNLILSQTNNRPASPKARR